MANGNPFSINPEQGVGRELAGLGQVLGEQRQARLKQQQQAEAKERAERRFGQARSDIQNAWETGDPQQIAMVSLKYPEMQEVIQSQYGVFNDARAKEASDFSRSLLTANPEDREDIYKRRIEMLEGQGRDASHSISSYRDYLRDPKGEMLSTEMVYAGTDPKGYDVFRRQFRGDTGSDKGVTANIEDFEYYQDLKSSDPESAKMFAKKANILPKDKQLSATAEKALIDSQDKFFASSTQSREYDLLADDYDRFSSSLPAGTASTFSEFLKSVSGSQDEASELRRRFSKVRLSEALKYLPPGPATDRDVAEAFKGVPKENANPEQVQAFLRGASKMARIDAEYQEFKSNYLSENNSTKGLVKAWKQAAEGGEIESINALTPEGGDEFAGEVIEGVIGDSFDPSPLSGVDLQAYEWAKANPSNPKAAGIMKKLRGQ